MTLYCHVFATALSYVRFEIVLLSSPSLSAPRASMQAPFVYAVLLRGRKTGERIAPAPAAQRSVIFLHSGVRRHTGWKYHFA